MLQRVNKLPVVPAPEVHTAAPAMVLLLRLVSALLCLLLWPVDALAHVAEQGFVLLLPTELYISGGIAALLLTIVILAVLPASIAGRLFQSVDMAPAPSSPRLATLASLVCLVLFILLLVSGLAGSRDPLANPLPLSIWTLWWIGFVSLHGIFGNLWRVLNPWRGVYQLLPASWRQRRLRLPEPAGVLPAIVLLLLFISFYLADPAPDDPTRLAWITAGYWLFTFVAILAFGYDDWMNRGECFAVALGLYARLAPVQHVEKRLRVGLPGWALLNGPAPSLSLAVFAIILLACGSFDGINETFWWLNVLDINPLEFPGRSAIQSETSIGLLLANVSLLVIFGACVATGLLLANHGVEPGRAMGFINAFTWLSLSLLPIAFVYHIAHFLTAFMVNIQYSIKALSDPLARGADLFGIGEFYVTTGFFNTRSSVRLIWLTQAGLVVFGHVIGVVMAHTTAIKLLGTSRHATLSQIPLALFMLAYTLLGLWLLASPRGA